MASQLRWILLGLGLALIVALWWWERRRATPAPAEESKVRNPDRFEPRLEGEAAVALAQTEGDPVADPPMRTGEDRPVPRGDPPLVTIDDLPENADSVVLAPEPLADARPAANRASAFERRRPKAEPAAAPTVIVPAPVEAGVDVVEPLPSTPEPEPESEPPPRQQRIVAIRLIGERERRIDGRELQQALAAEGLEFGRYSIFHRALPGGRAVYSVASLVEPGSFDPEQMAATRFPGISLFAIYPGPMAAPQAFDELLATARRLAERLGGSLQDDSGSSLTGQRVLSIREELVHFEHLVALSRSRPGA